MCCCIVIARCCYLCVFKLQGCGVRVFPVKGRGVWVYTDTVTVSSQVGTMLHLERTTGQETENMTIYQLSSVGHRKLRNYI